MIGSVVRTTGSGLACPDWPLCQGRLIPPLESHVLIEWFHRLVALLVSLSIVSLSALTLVSAPLRARLGGLAGLLLSLLATQVLLGALTVWKLLSPAVVSAHLATALLLFGTLLTLSVRAAAAAEPEAPSGPRPPGLLLASLAATLLVYAQAVLGGVVGSSHAGLACPDWPTCQGQWLPPLQGLVGLHMAHRLGGYAAALMVMVAALASRAAPDPRVRQGARLASWLVVAQVALGVANVLLETPIWVTALHIATATALLGLLLVTALRVAALPSGARDVVALASRAG